MEGKVILHRISAQGKETGQIYSNQHILKILRKTQ